MKLLDLALMNWTVCVPDREYHIHASVMEAGYRGRGWRSPWVDGLPVPLNDREALGHRAHIVYYPRFLGSLPLLVHGWFHGMSVRAYRWIVRLVLLAVVVLGGGLYLPWFLFDFLPALVACSGGQGDVCVGGVP